MLSIGIIFIWLERYNAVSRGNIPLFFLNFEKNSKVSYSTTVYSTINGTFFQHNFHNVLVLEVTSDIIYHMQRIKKILSENKDALG
jgi:hypothetical protein